MLTTSEYQRDFQLPPKDLPSRGPFTVHPNQVWTDNFSPKVKSRALKPCDKAFMQPASSLLVRGAGLQSLHATSLSQQLTTARLRASQFLPGSVPWASHLTEIKIISGDSDLCFNEFHSMILIERLLQIKLGHARLTLVRRLLPRVSGRSLE